MDTATYDMVAFHVRLRDCRHFLLVAVWRQWQDLSQSHTFICFQKPWSDRYLACCCCCWFSSLFMASFFICLITAVALYACCNRSINSPSALLVSSAYDDNPLLFVSSFDIDNHLNAANKAQILCILSKRRGNTPTPTPLGWSKKKKCQLQKFLNSMKSWKEAFPISKITN